MRITLNSAFFIIDNDNPADISSIDAQSFYACLILLFINTVHLLPRSTGDFPLSPAAENSYIGRLSVAESVCMNDPQPDEQASFRHILSITLFSSTCILFMSYPPISNTKSTPG